MIHYDIPALIATGKQFDELTEEVYQLMEAFPDLPIEEKPANIDTMLQKLRTIVEIGKPHNLYQECFPEMITAFELLKSKLNDE